MSRANDAQTVNEAHQPPDDINRPSGSSFPLQRQQSDHELFNTVIAKAPIVLWSIDRNGIFTVSEGLALEALGLKAGEVVGRCVFEMYADYPEILNDIYRAMKGEEVRSNSEVNGISFESWYAPVKNEAGEIDGVIGVATNITDRVHAEAAKRKMEERFETAFHSSPAAILITRLDDGAFVDVNRSFTKMCGYERSELIGKNAIELGMWEKSNERFEWINKIRRNGSSHDDQFHFLCKSGERRTGLVSAELIEFGGIPCILTTSVDITEREEMETRLRLLNHDLEDRVAERTKKLTEANERLQASEEKWRSLVENAPDFIINADRNGKIRYINRSAPGTPLESVPGSSIYEYTPPENHALLREQMAQVIETGRPCVYEASGRGPHGTLSWYATRISPIIHDGEVTGVTIVASDVTERKNIEERDRLRQTELEHLARMATVGQMTTELAHELNQPLAAITNYAGGCVRRIQAGDFSLDDLQNAAEEVAKQARRASETVAKLRQFVQRRETNPVPTSIENIVNEALVMIAAEIRQDAVQTRLNFCDNQPLVIADDIFIVHVLVNLFLNAIEAMAETPNSDRMLEVETRYTNENMLTISVLDRGRGIEPGKEETIFEPFHTGRADGIGLGLAISRNVIEKHQGSLDCRCREGGGMEFTFSLPTC